MRDETEDWYGRTFTDRRGRAKPHYLLCSECGCEIENCDLPTCAECGNTKRSIQVRQERIPEILYANVYEGLYEEIQEKTEGSARSGPVFVYAFISPLNHDTIYIGITQNPQARKSQHFCSDCPVGNWRREKGVDPVMVLLEKCATYDIAFYREAFLIAMIPGLINRDVESKRNATLRKLVPLVVLAPAHMVSPSEGGAR